MMKHISRKQIISIRKFIEIYCEKEYKGKRKLTHENMKDYFAEKGYEIPKTITFNQIKQEDVLRGDVLFVRDKVGKIVAYSNPLKLNVTALMKELRAINARKECIEAKIAYLNKCKSIIETYNIEEVEEPRRLTFNNTDNKNE